MNAEALREQMKTAVSANELKCGHKGKCPTCPTCKRFMADDFPPVKNGSIPNLVFTDPASAMEAYEQDQQRRMERFAVVFEKKLRKKLRNRIFRKNFLKGPFIFDFKKKR